MDPENPNLESATHKLETPKTVDTELTSPENQEKFEEVLQGILPRIGSEEEKIIQTEIMLALKLEGVIGKKITEKDRFLVNTIKEYIMNSPEKKEGALMVAARLMKRSIDE